MAQGNPNASQDWPLFAAISCLKLLVAFGVNESKILDFIRSAVSSVGEMVYVQPLLHRVEPADPIAWVFLARGGRPDQSEDMNCCPSMDSTGRGPERGRDRLPGLARGSSWGRKRRWQGAESALRHGEARTISGAFSRASAAWPPKGLPLPDEADSACLPSLA